MNTRIYRPRHQRQHPTAHRIAARLLQHAPILALRTRTLLRDIQQRERVGLNTAAHALRIARQQVAA